MALRRQWQDNATTDFAGVDPERTIAVLPVAAIEQHGPHLPLAVDACIGAGVVRAHAGALPAALDISVLPMMPVGKSNEHMAYPGTLTLSAETLIRLWTEIGESVERAGIRKLVILNSHGGQPQVMDIVARDLRARLRMFVVTVNYWAVAERRRYSRPPSCATAFTPARWKPRRCCSCGPTWCARPSGATSCPPRSPWSGPSACSARRAAGSGSVGWPRTCTRREPAAMPPMPTRRAAGNTWRRRRRTGAPARRGGAISAVRHRWLISRRSQMRATRSGNRQPCFRN